MAFAHPEPSPPAARSPIGAARDDGSSPEELAERIAAERVRVPAPTKALVVARTLLPAGWR